ncbi:hypothetical protein CK203_107384 [Vitis vinifera]|uniref:Uncharacterized protein n=1 Tax=Vitis vinifera TaxID=29760 RepID=A0A438EC49_VITVI|nr:hypothetical protein CK203_107384 [Vitis vinifera]
MEVVLPVEIEVGSLRVALEHQIAKMDWLRARYNQLNLLDENILKVTNHMHAYQKKMVRAFRKRVKPRKFQKGDLVLKDVDQPPFLEDIEESHNAFSIQPPLQGAYPIPLHDDVNSYMYACGPSPLKRFGIDVWDILHIQPRFLIQQNASRACPRSDSSIFIDPAGVYIEAYPMHCHVRVF